MKTCIKCKEEKPATNECFSRNGKYLRNVCKNCVNKYNKQCYENNKEHLAEYHKQRYQDNKERLLEYQKQWAKNNPEKRRAMDAKRDAIKRGATTGETFTRQDVLDRWGTDCHICKSPVDVLDWHQEHVVALVNGGEHSLANVKPSHPQCNWNKGSK